MYKLVKKTKEEFIPKYINSPKPMVIAKSQVNTLTLQQMHQELHPDLEAQLMYQELKPDLEAQLAQPQPPSGPTVDKMLQAIEKNVMNNLRKTSKQVKKRSQPKKPTTSNLNTLKHALIRNKDYT